MQFIDLQKQYRRLDARIQQRMRTVFDHGQFIMGPEVVELEERLAEYVGCRYCVSCSSGTDALLLILMAYNVGPGDAIFAPAFTFIATAEVISLLGATPIFTDIDPRTFNIDPESLRNTIESLYARKPPAAGIQRDVKPRGIIAVDLFGLPADYRALSQIAAQYGLFLIEDAAQSFGGVYRSKRAGNLADVGSTSFFPAKPLGCYGDGGAIMTDNEEFAQRLRSLRVHGQGTHKYENVRIGINGRLDTLQAAILLAKLEVFDDEMSRRQRIAKRYSDNLRDFVTVPHVPDDHSSAWAQYSVISDKRAELMSRLKQANIPTGIYYPKPLHLQAAFSSLGYAHASLPVSEKTSMMIFSLPMHPYLDRTDQDRVIDVFRAS